MIPMPIFFYLYGKKLRAKSKFAPAPDIQQDKRRDEEAKGSAENESAGSEGMDAEKDREKERTP